MLLVLEPAFAGGDDDLPTGLAVWDHVSHRIQF